MSKNSNPFYIKDCAISAIAPGVRSQVLSDFRDSIANIHPSCIYYHFWLSRLRVDYDEDRYYNDFARWSAKQLHDETLSERLNIINPSDFASIEALRHKIVDVIDERLEEQEFIPWSSRDESFQFVRGVLVIFDSPKQIRSLEELPKRLREMGDNSLFYHFIDARRRKGIDDFSEWLTGKGHQAIIDQFSAIDPYFISLEELRNLLIARVSA